MSLLKVTEGNRQREEVDLEIEVVQEVVLEMIAVIDNNNIL